MSLADLQSLDGSRAAGVRAYALVREILPICRSITGAGVRRTLDIIGARVPLDRYEVPSGTPVFDWQVPLEWNIRDAYVKNGAGVRVIDFDASALHVVSYSTPIRQRLALDELRAHLHSLPDRPDWIPYRTSYYKPAWGFCLRHRDLLALSDGEYEVCIDSTLEPGSLTYAECFVPGEEQREVLVFTHVCHPALANDNASGLACVTELARALHGQRHRYGYRFVFAPGTIGAITWLARNEATVQRIAHGLVLGLLGDRAALTYKQSGRGDALIDRAAAHVLGTADPAGRVERFSPYGYDERQFCSPGFDLPVGRLTRSPNDGYPEYHSSADNLALIDEAQLAGSIRAVARIFGVLEGNRTYKNLNPRCEPQLGRRGLFRPTGGAAPGQFEHALLWVLNQSDGRRSLLDICERAGLEFEVVHAAARALREVGLLAESADTEIRA